MPIAASNSAVAVWAILRKECRAEWRTRYGLNAALLFAVTSLAAVSLAAGRISNRTDILAGLFWIVLLFAALTSMSHAFVREVDGHTMLMLRLIASPSEIAAGKLIFNLLFLLVIEVVLVPLFMILMAPPPPHWGAFLGLLGLGTVALAASATLLGAIVSQSRGRGALFAGISLPLLMPFLGSAVGGTREMWAGHPEGVSSALRFLTAYAVALLAASLLLYDHLWED